MTINLDNPIFKDDEAARAYLEEVRWPHGPFCPHCGSVDVLRMEGKAHRPGLFHCRGCKDQFSVTVCSVMERSHIPLRKWVLAVHLMTSSKKGMSAHQLHRTLGITYKAAWFMAHRIREMMTDPNPTPLGGEGKVVEADEAYHGKKEIPTPSKHRAGRPYLRKGKAAEKRPIVGLVERGGEVCAMSMPRVTAANVTEVLRTRADRKSRLHTDESRLYIEAGGEFAAHETVKHSAKEYARGDVNTNSIEGFFGIFKRGMTGIYQHCGEQNLDRYLSEYAFRYNNQAPYLPAD